MNSRTAAERIARMIATGGAASLTAEDRKTAHLIIEQAMEDRDRGLFVDSYPISGPFRRELYPRHLEFFDAGRFCRERCFMGGNRVGKTYAGGYEMVCHLTGSYPVWWTGKKFDEPIRAVASGKTNETVRDIVQQQLLGDVRKNAKGRNAPVCNAFIDRDFIVPDSATYRTGVQRLVESVRIRYRDSKYEQSYLSFKAYEQGRGSFEGVARHVIWMDEEPDPEVYEECLMRTATIRGGGIIYITFTPLDGITAVVKKFLPASFKPRPAPIVPIVPMIRRNRRISI